MLWLQIVQYAGFFFAQITNSVLVYLIITKAGKLFGSYRHVMCVFAMYSLIYSWIEVLTQPVMHIKGQVFIVYMDSPLKPYKWIGMEITYLYCGSFALVISLLAAQFFYRYVAICRPDTLSKLSGFKLGLIFVPCVICFFLWYEFVFYGMANTVEKQEFMKEELRTVYNEDSETVPFIAPMYWSTNQNGIRKWKILDCLSAVGCVGIISVCFSTILYCAFNIYWTMKESQDHMSARTLELNHQLFVTLTFQTVLPFCMMYSPVGLLMTFPLFEVYVGRIANYVGASLAVYPALEPLIAMFCIKDFRRAVLCRSDRKKSKISSSSQSKHSAIN
ncbi:hypothetical protein L5515_006778 [Caenorhabditis briggsae]|uniref:Serpentine receptor class r-10 n=1 Tax=Caenorhabditis briggsae TaxID=6238 RepID=A0AAE9F087_CAEBR|nr:hypothetical protein L5515_006778 [Caenorhabditis briggsae]